MIEPTKRRAATITVVTATAVEMVFSEYHPMRTSPSGELSS
jgi:hypothetical protein